MISSCMHACMLPCICMLLRHTRTHAAFGGRPKDAPAPMSDGSFFEIAEVAQLRGAAPLVDACVAFTASSSAVKAAVDAGRCAPAVLELLGKVQPCAGPAKKQRLSL